MAITKYNLYDSASAANCDALCLAFLREALIPDWLGENGTVEPDSNNASLYVLTDSDGNTIAKLYNYAGAAGSTSTSAFFVDSTHTVGISSHQHIRYKTGYKTSKGAMIIIDYTNGGGGTGSGILIFGKTNNGKLAMVLKDPAKYYSGTSGTSYYGNAATAYGAVTGARNDDVSALTHGLTFGPMSSNYGSEASSNENQTILCPTPTHSNPGETSIIDGVFMMPWAQYRNEGKIQIGDKYYVTNGYWALED